MIDRIRLRLTAAYVGVLALILVLFGVVAVLVFRGEAYDRQDQLLLEEARSRADSVLAGRTKDFLPSPAEPYAAWAEVAGDGRVASSESDEVGLLSLERAATVVRTRKPDLATVPGHEGELRVASRPVLRRGQVIAVVQTGQLRADVEGDVNRLALVLVPTGLGALVLAAVGGLFTSGRAMRPVRDSFDRQRAFIADASHELKTPLTLIRADAEVLSRHQLESDQRALIDDLLAETDRMSAVLSDLLLLARLDAGKLAVAHEAFDICAVLDETRERFGARAASAQQRLELHCPNRARATGDRNRTAQIVAALVDNALRATPHGGNVELRARIEHPWIEIHVADDGPGFPPEQLPHLFERFHRTDPARGRHGGGTGLGLAIAHDLARAQGGALIAQSPPSGGATCTLRLPRSRVD